MRKFDLDAGTWSLPPPTPSLSHHVRHQLTRRAFLGSAAGVAGAAAGAALLPSGVLAARPSANATPRPTTQTLFGTFHVNFIGDKVDPSSIWDFNGFVAAADVQGTGMATNPDGSTETLLFDTDMRLMSGVYVGLDGAVHKGTFGFV